MQQLTGETVRQILAKSLGAVRPSDLAPRPELWAKRRRPLSAAPQAGLSAGAPDGSDGPCGPSGIERRLPRRAEVLWERLREGRTLPGEAAAARLLEQPFSGHALLVRQEPGCDPMISYAGAELDMLGAHAANLAPADPSPAAGISQRLVALALRAAAAEAPLHLDSDDDPDLASPDAANPDAANPDAACPDTQFLCQPLMFRAVALPLAAEAPGALSAVVVVSWRKLLSVSETDALHSELAVAIGWLSQAGPPPSEAKR